MCHEGLNELTKSHYLYRYTLYTVYTIQYKFYGEYRWTKYSHIIQICIQYNMKFGRYMIKLRLYNTNMYTKQYEVWKIYDQVTFNKHSCRVILSPINLHHYITIHLYITEMNI